MNSTSHFRHTLTAALLALICILRTQDQVLAQNIGGIGAQLVIDTTGSFTMPRIFSLVPNSPAYDSLRATDYIMSVNGVSCKDLTIEAVVALIRGEAGTTVKIITADTKLGTNPKTHELRRVGINLGPQADPKDAFFSACENEVNQMKNKGAVIIKTFNSDCGSYFFNFNATPGNYKIKVMALAVDGTKPDNGFSATARAFDNDHENEATNLGHLESKNATANVAQLTGTVTLKKDCVGTVAISLSDDNHKCHALYVVVYK